jgi:N-methylhydantoinase A/oxoprolinase/acetone carboxylase beta subunit
MVNLGWLLPEAFLGGEMQLRGELARRAFEEGPAQTLGMSVEEASMGAVQILTHSMVQSIEENSVRKGYDPRDFALVAEGGAGPLFAAQIALEVGTPWVLVPNFPGVTAALGLLATDMVYEYVSTVYQRLSQLDAAALERVFAELEEQAREQLERDGLASDRILTQRVADCRYLGQGYELRVDVGAGAIDDAWVEKLRADFNDIHEREYSRRFEDADIEIPNVRVRGVGLQPVLELPELEESAEAPDEALRYEGEAWFRVDGSLDHVPTRYYDRASLHAGNRLSGPAIVNQYDSTTVVPPGVSAHVDRFGNIVIDTGAASGAEALAAAAEVKR